MKLKQQIVFALLLLLSYQCSDPKPECKYGSPEPIFSKENKKVNQHAFGIEGQRAYEEILFENDLNLEIIQSGCDDITQVFQFNFPGDYSKEPISTWIELAIQNFA